jgi:hypothetical protein
MTLILANDTHSHYGAPGKQKGETVPDPSDGSAAPAWPTSMLELDPAEALIVWALRRWALGLQENAGHHLSLVSREFTRQLESPDAETAMGSFAALITGLQEHARRRVRHHQPCCPCLGIDEVWLVCLVGACQRGELCRARALAEWMVHTDGVGDLLDAATRLGRAMGKHYLMIPSRNPAAAPLPTARALVH